MGKFNPQQYYEARLILFHVLDFSAEDSIRKTSQANKVPLPKINIELHDKI